MYVGTANSCRLYSWDLESFTLRLLLHHTSHVATALSASVDGERNFSTLAKTLWSTSVEYVVIKVEASQTASTKSNDCFFWTLEGK